MDFKPSPERQILFDTLKKYFENEYSLSDRNIAAHSDLGYSKKAWEAMRDLGILESLIDPELDGFGGTALDISTVFEALGRGLVLQCCPEDVSCRVALKFGSEACVLKSLS